MPTLKRPKSLTDTVLEHLRNGIVSGQYELGSALSERRLAEELQVSKTPIRESLVLLKSEGLVDIRPQRGAFVFTLSAKEVIQICEFRLTIENAALKLAIEKDREGLLSEINEIVTRMKREHSRHHFKEYLSLDTRFHAAFFKYCGNHYLSESYERYVGKIAALRTHLAIKPRHTELSLQEHIALRDILSDGTDAEIEALLSAHIGRTRDSYSETVEDIAAADALKNAD